jgi:glycine/serine hydroxymethyltransferase
MTDRARLTRTGGLAGGVGASAPKPFALCHLLDPTEHGSLRGPRGD